MQLFLYRIYSKPYVKNLVWVAGEKKDTSTGASEWPTAQLDKKRIE